MRSQTKAREPTVGTEPSVSLELDRVPRKFPRLEDIVAGGVRFSVGVAGLLVAYATLWLAAWAVLPAVVPGWRSVVINSGSMSPSIRTGDVVIAAPSDGQRLSPDTVVVISNPAESGTVTHRIVSVNPDGSYRTKGDTNPAVDSTPVRPEQVVAVGRLVVPYAGLPLTWYWNGARLKLGIWGLGVVFSLWATRFAYPRPQPERFDHGQG